MRRTTWNYELKDLVRQRWRIGEDFDLREAYRFQPHFQKPYPSNSHIEDKIRQTLQNLRDEGIVEFIGDGRYRRIG